VVSTSIRTFVSEFVCHPVHLGETHAGVSNWDSWVGPLSTGNFWSREFPIFPIENFGIWPVWGLGKRCKFQLKYTAKPYMLWDLSKKPTLVEIGLKNTLVMEEKSIFVGEGLGLGWDSWIYGLRIQNSGPHYWCLDTNVTLCKISAL
jgi:hypothetical protein